jgi:hypothetical protein
MVVPVTSRGGDHREEERVSQVESVFPVCKTLTALDVAFGGAAHGMRELLPPYESIPKEFRNNRTEWNRLFSDWFYRGLSSLELEPKEGIDKHAALAHIRAVMSSFEPKHEHKEAGVAFLLSQWFTNPKWTAKK